MEQILEKCRELEVNAVCTIASDLGNVVASYVARNLGLPANSEQCIKVSSNKYEMRKAFKDNNVSVPKFFEIAEDYSIDSIKDIKYPIIVLLNQNHFHPFLYQKVHLLLLIQL